MTTLEPMQTDQTATLSPSQYRRRFAQMTAAGRGMALETSAGREAVASQLVSEMAFKPMLAEMRKFPLGNDMFSGGRGEEVFGERLDERLADIVAGQSNGLTRDIADRLKPRGAVAPNEKAQPVGPPAAAWWQQQPERVSDGDQS